jgi:ABC-2 type transport system permease protein
MVTIPVLTMRLFAEEKRRGTIELLKTYPLDDLGIVIAKFLASMLVFSTILTIIMGIYPLLLDVIWKVDFSLVLSGFIGLLFFGASIISVGLFFSALSNSQFFAAVSTYGFIFLFWYLTWNEAIAKESVVIFLNKLSLFDHFINFTEGLIDFKDIIYYFSFVVIFLYLTFRYIKEALSK